MEGFVHTFISLVFTNFIRDDLPSPLIVRSKIDCAKGCVLDPYCQSFFYVKVKLCYHIPELLENASGLNAQDHVDYYRVHKECPKTKGYIYHAAVNVCYKIHLNESQTWPDARHICQQEGGDLITLENKAKDELIKNTIFAIFLMSWLPYAVVSFISAFGDPTLISPLMATIPALVAKSAGLWNPLIYVATNKQFRYGFYAIIPCKGIKDSLVKKEEKQPESSQESDLDEEDDKKNTKKEKKEEKAGTPGRP
ncbi:rhodopsin-like [Haliotis asinina]|uniref:rhodopsin-like n=1 Tax=Haliotis asinina TaxID=109174 RepID=UPI0035318786